MYILTFGVCADIRQNIHLISGAKYAQIWAVSWFDAVFGGFCTWGIRRGSKRGDFGGHFSQLLVYPVTPVRARAYNDSVRIHALPKHVQVEVS